LLVDCVSGSKMWPAERGAAAEATGEDDINSNNAGISDEVKNNILELLKQQRYGINLNCLESCYKDQFSSVLDFRKQGFDTLLHMLKTVKEIR